MTKHLGLSELALPQTWNGQGHGIMELRRLAARLAKKGLRTKTSSRHAVAAKGGNIPWDCCSPSAEGHEWLQIEDCILARSIIAQER